MNPVHYAAMLFDGRWRVVSKGLRWGDYPTMEAALEAARRMARASSGLGLEIQLHVHEDTGLLHRVDAVDAEREGEPARPTRVSGDGDLPDAASPGDRRATLVL